MQRVILDAEFIKASTDFNIGLIYAHCGGISEEIPLKTARAVLAKRLNNLLYAGAGVLINLMQKVKNENR